MIASLLVVPAVAAGGLRLQAVSARPDLVTAGDVLITATVPRDQPLDGVRLTLEGTDVTGSFRADAATHTLTGFLDQLRPGTNRLIATAGALHDQLTMINHPATGPVISGPHEAPFICTTDRFTLVDGTTLGAPLDADCSIATRVDYAYRSTSGRTRPLPDPTVRPADLASTTTITGATVPFLIRIETGTINRAIYQIAMLHDPATDAPTFDGRSPGWNGRLIYTFGGGCRRGWYTQGATTGGVLRPGAARPRLRGRLGVAERLRQQLQRPARRRDDDDGQGTVRRGLRRSGVHDRLGLVGRLVPEPSDRRQLSRACSTASWSAAAFPDVAFGTIHVLTDARLLEHYFTELRAAAFSEEEQRQVSGFGRWRRMANLSTGAAGCIQAAELPAVLPPSCATTRTPIPTARAATSTTTPSTSTAATRTPGSPGGRWTTSASSTGSPRSTRA